MNSFITTEPFDYNFFYGIQNFLSRKFISNIYVCEKKNNIIKYNINPKWNQKQNKIQSQTHLKNSHVTFDVIETFNIKVENNNQNDLCT